MFSLSSNIGLPTPNLGSIYVRLDKGEYSPGDQVSGTILLDLYSPFQQGNQIWLTLAGVEQTRLVEVKKIPGDNNQDIEEKIEHAEMNFFFNQKIPVYAFPSAYIPPGQYSFPFSFALQTGIPSSFQYKFKVGLEDCFARVSYEMQASLEALGIDTPSLAFSIPFNVNQPVGLSNNNTRKEMEAKVDSCCCIDKGVSKITSYFEKTEYIPGEMAFLITEADNTNCKAAISGIQAEFAQSLKFTAKGYTHQITNSLNSMNLSGIGPGETRLGPNALRLQVQLSMNARFKENCPMLQPTCRGKLVSNEYYLVNTLSMDACICCGDHPNCRLQLNVRNPSLEYSPWSGMPAAWSPQVMPVNNLQFSSEYAFQPNNHMGQPPNNGANFNYQMNASPAMPMMPPPPS